MGWYGPQGDCGCCEGLCDLPGVYTDSFTAVDNKWRYVESGASAVAEIDTAKPGKFFSGSPPIFGGSQEGWITRCRSINGLVVGSVLYHRAKILVDYSSSGSAQKRYDHVVGFQLPENIAVVTGVSLRFNSSISGEYQAVVLGAAITNTGVFAANGDVVEVAFEVASFGTGDNVNMDIDWIVNSVVVHSDSRTFSLPSTLAAIVGGYFLVSADSFGANSGSTWTQNHESGLIL